MPCRSDYLEPSSRERELQRTARLLVYVNDKLGLKSPKRLNDAADNCYCNVDFVPELCGALSGLTKAQTDDVVYARTKIARDLANWWEDHQEADRKRETDEAAKRERERLIKSALKKLTPKEVAALRGDK